MSQTVKTPPGAAPSEASNRVTLGLSNRLLARPEVGALVAAVVIFIFFLIVAPSFRSAPSFFTVHLKLNSRSFAGFAGNVPFSSTFVTFTFTTPPFVRMPFLR